MIAMSKLALFATGLLLAGGAMASSEPGRSAAQHAAATAKDLASGHGLFHHQADAASDADRQCDVYRNHGAYVSSVARNASQGHGNETRDDDDHERSNHSRERENESADERADEAREHGNGTRHHENETQDERAEEAREHGNETRHHENETQDERAEDARDDGNETTREAADHGDAVSVAAHSDIGKCGGHEQGDGSDSGDDSHAEDQAHASHGRSGEARSEHPPRNDQHP